MLFAVTGVLTAVGSVVPAAVAIIAPIALGFAVRFKINPVLMGLMVINGATAGGFSPISIFGSIVNGVVETQDLAGNPTLLFFSSLVFNSCSASSCSSCSAGASCSTGAWTPTPTPPSASTARRPDGQPVIGGGAVDIAAGDAELDRDKIITLVGIVTLVALALLRGRGVGRRLRRRHDRRGPLAAMPHATKGAAEQGRLADRAADLRHRHVRLADRRQLGTIDWLGDEGRRRRHAAARRAADLLHRRPPCRAFASTTGILGALIPLAVPFLEQGEIGAVGVIIALCISSSVVDSSPYSTSGALTVANTPEDRRDYVYKRLLQWGMSMIIIAPITAWAIFVLPGWL